MATKDRETKKASVNGEREKPKKQEKLLTIPDFEKAAKKKLGKMAYDYYRSGSDREQALKANRQAFDKYAIWYRTLTDVSNRDLTTSLLGTSVALPVCIAPTAYHQLAHEDGELATARAAAKRGVIMVASTLATTTLEEIAEATSAPKWFQLYVHKDRGLTQSLVERAEAAGYDAIVLTVDTPLLGKRVRDERNGFTLPEGMRMANLMPPPNRDGTSAEDDLLEAPGSLLANYARDRHDTSFTWDDIAWLRSLSHLPLVVKGVVRADDAARAVHAGAAAIIVSNHGGRQLDYAPATLDALPGVVQAAAGRAEVYMDGGIRSGGDVLVALALGARAVFIGRPVLWGLAVNGEAGVSRVLELFGEELSMAMALSGVSSVIDIDRSLVARR